MQHFLIVAHKNTPKSSRFTLKIECLAVQRRRQGWWCLHY